MKQDQGIEATEAVFRLQGKKSLFIPGCVQSCIILTRQDRGSEATEAVFRL